MKNNKLKYGATFPGSGGVGVYESIGGSDWLEIGYETLFTAPVEIPRLASGDIGAAGHAHPRFRVVGTSFATGQAEEVSAALWAESKSYDPEKVHLVLEKQGVAILV